MPLNRWRSLRNNFPCCTLSPPPKQSFNFSRTCSKKELLDFSNIEYFSVGMSLACCWHSLFPAIRKDYSFTVKVKGLCLPPKQTLMDYIRRHCMEEFSTYKTAPVEKGEWIKPTSFCMSKTVLCIRGSNSAICTTFLGAQLTCGGQAPQLS